MFGQSRASCLSAVLLAAAALAAAVPAQAEPAGPERPTIIGGTVAKDGRWPSVVGLIAAGSPSAYAGQFCAGSLIARRYVLTAAHCVDGASPSEIEILVGTQDLKEGGRRIAVKSIHMHPDYDPMTADSDVAVIRLARPARGVRLMKLVNRGTEAALAGPGARAVAVGWGDTDPTESASFPNRLQEVALKVISTAACNGAEAYAGELTDRMLCAGTMAGGRDSCQGDSGGPLVVRDAAGRLRAQAGVVSWGNGCAEPGFPGVYSRVASLHRWIRAKVASGR